MQKKRKVKRRLNSLKLKELLRIKPKPLILIVNVLTTEL